MICIALEVLQFRHYTGEKSFIISVNHHVSIKFPPLPFCSFLLNNSKTTLSQFLPFHSLSLPLLPAFQNFIKYPQAVNKQQPVSWQDFAIETYGSILAVRYVPLSSIDNTDNNYNNNLIPTGWSPLNELHDIELYEKSNPQGHYSPWDPNPI